MKSPYVVALYGCTQDTNHYKMLLEYCNGGDLSGFVKARGNYLKEEEARFLMAKVMQGMAVLHEKNVTHRDLKLENILLHFQLH
jgi:serine/threonine protein kinase